MSFFVFFGAYLLITLIAFVILYAVNEPAPTDRARASFRGAITWPALLLFGLIMLVIGLQERRAK